MLAEGGGRQVQPFAYLLGGKIAAYQLGDLGLPLGQPIAGRHLPQVLGGQHPGGRSRQQVVEFPLQRILQRVQNMELLGVKVNLVPLPE